MRMSHTQKAKVFGVLFVLAASVFFFGPSTHAQAADRFDRLSTTTPQSGSTIVCIVYSNLNGVGVPIPALDAGACSDQGGHVAACDDGIDNDGDGLIDSADPGCHADGNANNGATYVSSLDDESATVSGPPPVPACMNGTDDDGDGLIDAADPGCHTDGDATNMGSYMTGDTSEGDPLPPENTLALCSDGIDNDGDGAIDLADTGCSAFKPKLTVTVAVSNAHGGTASTSDMSLFVDGLSIGAGIATTTTTGAHTVSATTTATSTPYTVSYAGDCNSSGSTTLAIGDSKTCAVSFVDTATTTDAGGGNGAGGGGGDSTPAPSGGGGGGGNGPIVNSLGGGGGGPISYGSTATITPVTSCDTYLTAFIRFGADNDTDQVRRLQTVLHDDEGAALDVNGVYDTPTLMATRAFQQKYAAEILTPWHLDAPTGFVYLTTRKKVNEIYCRNTKQFPLSQAESAVIERIVSSSAVTVTQHASVTAKPVRAKSTASAPASVAPAATSAPSIQEIQKVAAEAQAGAAAGSNSDIFGSLRGFFDRLFNRSK